MLRKASLLGAIAIAASGALSASAGHASRTAGLRVSLTATGHSIRVGAPWTYTIRAKNAAGKPIAAAATVGPRGGTQSVRRFTGTLRRTITWPTAGSFVFRAVVRAGGLRRAVDYRVTVISPPTGTQQSPVPLGHEGTLIDTAGGAWRFVVGAITRDATQQVLAASDLNQPPRTGRQYFMLSVTVTYAGTAVSNLRSLALQLLGASGTTYTAERDSCGVLPVPDLYFDNRGKTYSTGAKDSGNICFSVLSSDAASLVLFNYAGAGQSWFALR